MVIFFRPTRQEIIEPTEVEYGDPRTVFNPLTGQLDQVQDREVTFGQYGALNLDLNICPRTAPYGPESIMPVIF